MRELEEDLRPCRSDSRHRPTDSEVYNRWPTLHPGHVYEIPQASVPFLITSTFDLIQEILDEINRDPSPGRNVVGVRPPANEEPPPAYKNITPHGPATSARHSPCDCVLNPDRYVRMAPTNNRSYVSTQPPIPRTLFAVLERSHREGIPVAPSLYGLSYGARTTVRIPAQTTLALNVNIVVWDGDGRDRELFAVWKDTDAY